MTEDLAKSAMPVSAAHARRFRGSIWTLLLLAPFVSEVLSGATRTSVIFVLIPEVMVWGIGALLARELVRRWRAGGVSLLCLGLALSIAEEFLIQQTSLAPLPFPGSHPAYGRVWGINLLYFLFMLGFESVWVVLVPVQLTELFFPKERDVPWLRKRGAIACCAFFLLGCRVAWYGWTQQALKRMGVAEYHPPAVYFVAGITAIGALAWLAYLLRKVGRVQPGTPLKTVPWLLAGMVALVMAAAWFYLIAQNFLPQPIRPFWVLVAGGLGWALLALVLFTWWSSRASWGALHGFSSAAGVVLAGMATPYLTIGTWPAVDAVGIVIFDALALVGLAILGAKIWKRAGNTRSA